VPVLAVVLAISAAGFAAVPARCLPVVVRSVFVTTAAGTADLDSWTLAGHPGLALPAGVAAGDTICQTIASDAGLANAAAFVAWLSDGTDDAWCRALGLTGKRADDCGQDGAPLTGGMARARLGSTVFTSGYAALFPADPLDTREPLQPARVFESGLPITTDIRYWTGTTATGTADADSCGDWRDESAGEGLAGSPTATLIGWTSAGKPACSTSQHLLCVERGIGSAPPIPTRGGRRAFVTSVMGTGDLGSWADGGGLGSLRAGNRICQTRAAAAGLAYPETFAAWLSTSASDARDRFAPVDGPWVRMDGLQIAASVAALTSGSLQTAIDRDELGHPVFNAQVWTGTSADGTTADATCAEWTDGSSAASGEIGRGFESSARWTQALVGLCDQPKRLYCLSTADPALLFADGFDSGSTRIWAAAGP
jgi:hypothetical protein